MKTELREKMQETAEDLYPSCVYRDEERVAFIAGSEAMYAELSPIVEWVSVKDRKPTNDTTVNIKVKNFINYIFATALYSAEENKWFTSLFHDEIRLEVTHWKKIDL